MKSVKDKGYLDTEEKETMFLEVVNDLEGLWEYNYSLIYTTT